MPARCMRLQWTAFSSGCTGSCCWAVVAVGRLQQPVGAVIHLQQWLQWWQGCAVVFAMCERQQQHQDQDQATMRFTTVHQEIPRDWEGTEVAVTTH